MTKTDLLLLILTYKPGLNLSIFKFQFSVFYVQEEYSHYLDSKFLFEPSSYGPVSDEVLLLADSIPELIRVSQVDGDKYPSYSATMEGFEYVEKLTVEPAVTEYIDLIMKFVISNSTAMMIKCLSVENPEYFKSEEVT